jgi:5-methyltetrahydrofolate--homocysteine methyltransferase
MARPHILDALADRVLLCDGGMGSRVQALTLDVDKDYWGKENCTDVLNLSRPDMVREIHRGYFEAGADMVLTNTFGGSPVTLGEFELEDRAFEINKLGGELAREAAESFADGRHRWVIGDIGPGTKLPSLGHIKYDDLQAALEEQCRGLIAGGVDAILTETNQDTLFIKAAVNAAKAVIKQTGSKIPIFVQVTVETTGTLLVGPDIAAAATVVHSLDVPLIGLNCATGPQEMAEHVRWLSQNWPGKISIQPNAGLPELVDGQTHYPLEAAEMASWMERFVLEDGVNLIGGCCGTSTPHIAALDAMLRKHDAAAGRRRCAESTTGSPPSPRSTAPSRCGKRMPISPSASAATPMAPRSGVPGRKRMTGTAASPSAASRWARAPTASTSAPPSSAATRWRR